MMFTTTSRSFALVAVLVVFSQCAAFQPSASSSATVKAAEVKAVVGNTNDDRRAFLSRAASLVVGGTLGASSLLNINVPPASASGGATAGGAYLLSAKQRYNDRVIKGVKGFLSLEASLKSGSVEEAKTYFAGDAVGTFGDISTAGYLLANAFRRSANQSPDSLPSVKVSQFVVTWSNSIYNDETG